MMPRPISTPRWMTAIIIIALLPVFQMPVLLANCPAESSFRLMVWIYPIYAAVAAFLAWQCYPQRRALSWILVALLVLSHVAIWTLVLSPEASQAL